MPTSKTQICNMALGHVGVAATIQDIDTENSVEAENCRLFFDHCREVILETKPWGFAKREVTLASLGSPPTGWLYRYKYPNFVKRANRIINPASRTPGRGNKIPFKVVDGDDQYGKAILTDQENAVLEYNYNVTDVNLFSATFVQALSLFLATSIAMPLRVNAEIQTVTQQLFTTWNSEASSLDLEEEEPDQEAASEFETFRG